MVFLGAIKHVKGKSIFSSFGSPGGHGFRFQVAGFAKEDLHIEEGN